MRHKEKSEQETEHSQEWGKYSAHHKLSQLKKIQSLLARIASKTLEVAIVFCSRSLLGCRVPKRTSAFAAVWNTISHPVIALVNVSKLSVSPLISSKSGERIASFKKGSCPVEKLSYATIFSPLFNKRFVKLLPIKPAAPVINILENMIFAFFYLLS